MKSYRQYNWLMLFLSVLSIILILLDLLSVVSITSPPYLYIDLFFVLVFTGDYLYRFVLYDDKKSFFKHHIFDLLSIIPFYSFFRIFRLSRIFRILRFSHVLRLSRFTRLFSLKVRSQREIKSLLHTNGLIYVLYISVLLILFSATLFSVAEDISFSESLWWAMVTAATVGHAELYPLTLMGRAAATLLMFLGLSLIGVLTSSLTTYFSKPHTEEMKKIEELEIKIDSLLAKMEDKERNK